MSLEEFWEQINGSLAHADIEQVSSSGFTQSANVRSGHDRTELLSGVQLRYFVIFAKNGLIYFRPTSCEIDLNSKDRQQI